LGQRIDFSTIIIDLVVVSIPSIEVNIQIRTVEAAAAVGAGDFAVPFDHLTAAAVAQVNLFG
jgi:hypothetical protein